VPPDLIHELERRLERAESRLKSLRGQLERAQDPEIQRRFGDLILARFSEIRRGSAGVKLLDFDGREVEIKLDPSLTPGENARRFYQEAARSERARETLPRLIEKAERAADKWAGALSRASAGEPVDDLVSIPEPLGTKPPREPSARAGSVLPYKRFVSTGGLEIRVGRGARHNDDLTFHHSAPTDIWLHVQQSAGAHVILRWPKREAPPRQDLAEAAILAALYSSDRHSGSVPVVWTRRRHVRKPRGSSAGSVVPERTKTVFVTPDRDLIERLTVNE
jgi:predicted ribosome quality control (RQC) complex YloA/Tae2 family protein